MPLSSRCDKRIPRRLQANAATSVEVQTCCAPAFPLITHVNQCTCGGEFRLSLPLYARLVRHVSHSQKRYVIARCSSAETPTRNSHTLWHPLPQRHSRFITRVLTIAFRCSHLRYHTDASQKRIFALSLRPHRHHCRLQDTCARLLGCPGHLSRGP